ncbi:MAG TPA: hypothetical protein VKZ59_02425, partial [Acidobacteriota bacterium]|nr:hypothetical protein [Acidobacteriota bacterium]
KISRLESDSALCRRRSGAGLIRAASLRWERTAANLRRIFQEAVDGASESACHEPSLPGSGLPKSQSIL